MSSSPSSMLLVPATLKEASLDSPIFRGTVIHYGEQVELLEKWLDQFIKASLKMVHEIVGLEDLVNTFLFRAVPTNISSGLIDHDYTILAMQKYVEGSRGFWGNMIIGAKKVERTVLEPLLAFQRSELKNFKETRRALELAQTKYDGLLARYLSQSKSKEPSSLREDAFQLYEARKSYFKTCFDFCVAAPTLRAGLDRTITKVLSDMWREQTSLRKETTAIVERCRMDVERVRAWSDAMENNAAVFRRQLAAARRELEAHTKKEYQPARELDEYSISTVPYLTSRGGGGTTIAGNVPSEKQGWLFMRTLTGKPTRSVWVRRWFFVKAGVFGWLVQGYRGGGVEESEKVGVLLCNIKPAFQEERRFCFEVKTKDATLLLQAETQPELTSWLDVFEQAKRTAVGSSSLASQAFSIIPPSAPAPPSEPAYVTKGHDGNTANSDSLGLLPRHLRREGRGGDRGEDIASFERSFTLGPEIASASSRNASFDVSRGLDSPINTPTSATKDKHKKSGSIAGERNMSPASAGGGPGGGFSALIAASHGMLPFQSGDPSKPTSLEPYRANTLAPATLVGGPAPANLLRVSMLTSGRLAGSEAENSAQVRGHRKTVSLDIDKVHHGKDLLAPPEESGEIEYPPKYPIELRVQDEQFRVLFPGRWNEIVLFVFRATWSPNETQELPGRCFVTADNIYFYSYYMGLAFTDITPLTSITEVKAAPERDCDYLFLHLRPGPEDEANGRELRLVMKTFLEPLRLLQRRLLLLVKNASATETNDTSKVSSAELLSKLVDTERESDDKSADTESWEDIGLYMDDVGNAASRREGGEVLDIRIDHEMPRGIGDRAKEATRVKLPSSPVVYEPPGMTRKSLEREFGVSPQALFHVIFGDLSSLFQDLYAERRAQDIYQGPWKRTDSLDGKLSRKFAYQVQFVDILGRSRKADVVDHQTIEKQEEHICYVISDVKTPWHLPHRQDFMLVSRVVITYVGQQKCKLAVWTGVEWKREPRFSKGVVEKQALDDLDNDALDLGDIVADQLRKLLPSPAPTKKAIQIFGTVGGASGTPVPTATGTPSSRKPSRKLRQHRLSRMLFETCLSTAESAISTVVLSIIALLRSLSIHRILVISLAISALYNVSLTTRSSLAYWAERRADKFLSSVEMAPNGIMARALHVREIDELLAPSASNATASPDDGPCFGKFMERAADRKARNRLGMYRHDLVVALRMVNRLERDLAEAEWGRWVMTESRRCSGPGARNVMTEGGELGDWLAGYCKSCLDEWKKIEERDKARV